MHSTIIRSNEFLDYLCEWSKVDKLKTFQTPFTPVFSIVQLWSDQQKGIFIPGVNGLKECERATASWMQNAKVTNY